MPLPQGRLIPYERLAAPQEDLGVLIEPGVGPLRRMLDEDWFALLAEVRVLDSTASELRRSLRQRFRLVGPVVLSGHQAEFFHAGVLSKTIAADALAAQSGARAVFLTVDSDLPKGDSLAVPHVRGRRVEVERLAMPGIDTQLATECQPHVGRDVWEAWFRRAGEACADSSATLLSDFESGWFGADGEIDFVDAVVRGRAAVERSVGLGRSLELRISHLCATPEFRAFVAHLALDAPSFAKSYNTAQRDYRVRHRVRNPQRPAALLHVEGERVELPFWVYRRGERRRALFVSTGQEELCFFADGEPLASEPRAELSSAARCAKPLAIENDGWVIRPRALALSGFTRLFLSDLFIHGIGGAKYDEMMEDFVARFFGVEVPPACCVTATLRLDLPRSGVSKEELLGARHAARDALYNPQRRLAQLPADLLRQRAAFIEEWRRLRCERRGDHAARRTNYHALREINRRLVEHATDQVEELHRRVRDVESALADDRAALDREYFFALHSKTRLSQLVARIRADLSP